MNRTDFRKRAGQELLYQISIQACSNRIDADKIRAIAWCAQQALGASGLTGFRAMERCLRAIAGSLGITLLV
ncbi:MAG: hypothetical protein ACREC9_05160 [Methylocella sp.]